MKKYCIRSFVGIICIAFGILVIMTRVYFWAVYGRFMPQGWGGQFLIGAGAGLLGLPAIIEPFNKRREDKEDIV